MWTGSVDCSSNYHSITTERKQFSHTSDRGTPAHCKKKKKKLIGREMQAHTILAILERQWWKETAVHSTINLKINLISLMVHFWLNISLQKSEWKGCKKLQMSHDCIGNRQWELSHLFLLLLCAASLSTLLSWTSCTNQQPVPFPTESFLPK